MKTNVGIYQKQTISMEVFTSRINELNEKFTTNRMWLLRVQVSQNTPPQRDSYWINNDQPHTHQYSIVASNNSLMILPTIFNSLAFPAGSSRWIFMASHFFAITLWLTYITMESQHLQWENTL